MGTGPKRGSVPTQQSASSVTTRSKLIASVVWAEIVFEVAQYRI